MLIFYQKQLMEVNNYRMEVNCIFPEASLLIRVISGVLTMNSDRRGLPNQIRINSRQFSPYRAPSYTRPSSRKST